MKDKQGKDWQDFVIIGSIIGGAILIGIIFIFSQKKTEPPTIQTSQSQSSSSSSKTLPSSVGWIRIGAVNNRLGIASVGESLIATTQPVTISPPIVPSIGDQVSITNNIDVNLRNTFPKPPNYRITNAKLQNYDYPFQLLNLLSQNHHNHLVIEKLICV